MSTHQACISVLENILGKEATKEFLPPQPGDLKNTCANVDELVEEFNYRPTVAINEGIKEFVDWYRYYFRI